jgi:hypothetical protein
MALQVVHIAMLALGKPLAQPLRSLAHIQVGNSNGAKAQLGTPGADSIRKIGPYWRHGRRDRLGGQIVMLG